MGDEMDQLLALSSSRSKVVHAAAATPFKLESFVRGQAGREGVEEFIARTFRETYGAEITHFSDVLLGCRDSAGNWVAALGYTTAGERPIFLEQYLDQPIELALAGHVSAAVARREIVEVGNLASVHAGAARKLIIEATYHLYSIGLRWVTFTATASLLNSFSRLRLRPQVLARADPTRLSDGGKSWGSYYLTQPQVMFGDIHYGHSQIS